MDFKLRLIAVYISALQLGMVVNAQEISDADASFIEARDIAFEGKWSDAKEALNELLDHYPEYTDAKILMGKIDSWNGNYDDARRNFNRITSIKKEEKDAWLAAIKNEIYANNLNIALGLANKALHFLKEDNEVSAIRNQIIEDLNRVVPIQEKLKTENREVKTKNRIAISSDLEVFDVVFDPMYQATLEYQRQTKFGKILPRITYAQRFEETGTQFELDGYPILSKTFHGYFNYGFSNSILFPRHRAGVEIYAELPKAYEVSLGVRHVRFDESNASIFTGSFGLYRGNYYVSARPYISARNDGQVGWAGTLLARKYGRDGNNFIGCRASYGFDSELNQFIVDGVLLSETQLFLESQQFQFEYQFSNPQSTNIYTLNAGVRRQELQFDSGSFFWGVTAGMKYQFQF